MERQTNQLTFLDNLDNNVVNDLSGKYTAVFLLNIMTHSTLMISRPMNERHSVFADNAYMSNDRKKDKIKNWSIHREIQSIHKSQFSLK